jgi:hypothetical protein
VLTLGLGAVRHVTACKAPLLDAAWESRDRKRAEAGPSA